MSTQQYSTVTETEIMPVGCKRISLVAKREIVIASKKLEVLIMVEEEIELVSFVFSTGFSKSKKKF